MRCTREKRRRTALIRGLRFYLTKAGKKAYFCYRLNLDWRLDNEISVIGGVLCTDFYFSSLF